VAKSMNDDQMGSKMVEILECRRLLSVVGWPQIDFVHAELEYGLTEQTDVGKPNLQLQWDVHTGFGYDFDGYVVQKCSYAFRDAQNAIIPGLFGEYFEEWVVEDGIVQDPQPLEGHLSDDILINTDPDSQAGMLANGRHSFEAFGELVVYDDEYDPIIGQVQGYAGFVPQAGGLVSSYAEPAGWVGGTYYAWRGVYWDYDDMGNSGWSYYSQSYSSMKIESDVQAQDLGEVPQSGSDSSSMLATYQNDRFRWVREVLGNMDGTMAFRDQWLETEPESISDALTR
jgi:hypothetical protein